MRPSHGGELEEARFLAAPALEMTLVAAVCVAVAGVHTLVRGVDAGWLGWWMSTSFALVAIFGYLDRYAHWYAEGFASRGLASTAAASLAPVLVVGAAFLSHRPQSAILGAVMVAPFVVIAERWRRARVQVVATPL